MRQPLSVLLISIFVLNLSASALPINKDDLLQLKPLISERLYLEAKKEKEAKIIGSNILKVLGLGMIALNFTYPIDAVKSSWMLAGGTLLANSYYLVGLEKYGAQQMTIDDSGLSGGDREIASYILLKDNAYMSRSQRLFASALSLFLGVGSMLLINNSQDVSQQTKDTISVMGILLATTSVMEFFDRSDSEKIMDDINHDLNLIHQ